MLRVENCFVILQKRERLTTAPRHDKTAQLDITSTTTQRKDERLHADPYASHPLRILSWALPTAFGALSWILSAVQFWREIAAERRAAAAAAAIFPVTRPLPSAATLTGVAIAIPATIAAVNTLLSVAADNATATAEKPSADPAATADGLSSAADNAAAAMRPASTAAPGPFATTTAFSAAAAMFSPSGPSTTTTSCPPAVSPAADAFALSEPALLTAQPDTPPTEMTSSCSPYKESLPLPFLEVATLYKRVPSK